MCLDLCQDVLRLLDFAEFGMADDKSNERPPRYGRHFRVAGRCLAISSSRGQYDAAKVFIPSHSVWVAALGFGYFNNRLIRPVRVLRKSARILRMNGSFGLRATARSRLISACLNWRRYKRAKPVAMAVRLVRVELQRGFCHLQCGMQII